MLWLPKWLRDDTPPADGVSRRTFLFLGASAAVGALVAPTTSETLTETGFRWNEAALRGIFYDGRPWTVDPKQPASWIMVSRELSRGEALRRWPV